MKTNEELEREIDDLRKDNWLNYFLIAFLALLIGVLFAVKATAQETWYSRPYTYKYTPTGTWTPRAESTWVAPCLPKLGKTIFTFEQLYKCMNDLYFDWRNHGKRRRTIMELERMDGLE